MDEVIVHPVDVKKAAKELAEQAETIEQVIAAMQETKRVTTAVLTIRFTI